MIKISLWRFWNITDHYNFFISDWKKYIVCAWLCRQRKYIFKSLTWKHCLFTSICFIGYQQNWSKNTMFLIYITWKVLYNSLSKAIITKFCTLPTPHTKFSLNKNMPNYNRFVPSPPHTQNLVWIKTCPIIIVLTSIAIWKRLVIY